MIAALPLILLDLQEGRYGADPYLTNMLAGGEWK